ncbi:S-layer homology domain-containing protein [Thermosediminibacter litoriperuensis]|uniref:S-layer family protein n=1 Tax=Thermosediminibacter litoriperuensis TaxID=291989 RepID=A0A5S5AVW0_9FIRM|nr:S-layer homology domain-containing protein [Thermosediminibacter litoriperuensis]TYP57475.1 S-layer family protein [Thermosediminibacter litoriperuensis]
MKQEPEPLPFDDIKVQPEDAEQITSLAGMGIMEGTSLRRFSPQENLTRAQVITILVRALGLENNAPPVPYHTGFRDDAEIPAWAKDAVYVGREIGLARGDEAGCFRPNDPVTRAESAAFLNRFITYLQKDLQRDFRERIIDF